MRDELEPCKRESRVIIWPQLLQEVSHIKENLSLSAQIKTVGDIDRCQDVDQHSMVGLLIEIP